MEPEGWDEPGLGREVWPLLGDGFFVGVGGGVVGLAVGVGLAGGVEVGLGDAADPAITAVAVSPRSPVQRTELSTTVVGTVTVHV